MKAFKWIVLILIIGLLAACSSQTPVAETAAPEQPTATPPLAPAATAPSASDSQATPEGETAPVEESPETSQPIQGWKAVQEQGNWVLVGYGDTLNPTVVQPGTYVTINFGSVEGQVNGSGGCNSYSAGYSADDSGNLAINDLVGSTKVACDTGMEQEAVFFNALGSVSGYTMTERGELLLDYDSGTVYDEQLVFIAETTLVDTVWVLAAYGTPLGGPANLTPSKPGVVTTAIFSANGTLNGFTGCNNYVANYTVHENQITIGLGSTSLVECAVGMEQQRAYMLLLNSAQSYTLGVNALEITSADGSVLRFSAQHFPLENIRWNLAAIDGETVPSGVSPNALFTPADSPVAQAGENSVNGSTGCNTYFGPYTLAGDTITAGPFGVTRMMCEEHIMQVEQALLAGLESAKNYQITGNQLTLTSDTGSLLFYADRYPLEGPKWILTGSGPVDNPQPPVEGGIFTASFERQFGMPSGTKAGATGCRNYTAAYTASYDRIKVNLPQTSQAGCSDAQLEAEQGYFLGLNAARDYRILGNELYVYYDNAVLTFFGDYPSAEVGPLAPLHNTQWRLSSMNTSTVIPGSEVTILFEINTDGLTGKINGSSGCNTYNADIKSVFSLGPIISSAVSCETSEGVMQQEGVYLTALQTANSIWVEGNSLRITTDSGTLNFTSRPPEPAQPTATPAALSAVIIAPGDEHPGATITFDASLSTPQDGITSYRWWFTGDDTAEGVKVQRTYDSPGAYDGVLTVTDSGGQKSEASVKVRIHNYLVGPVWVHEDGVITLRFDGSKLSGNAGCSDYSAAYTAANVPGKANDIKVEPISSTQQSCDDDVMDKEDAYLADLNNAKSYTINVKTLSLTTSERTLIFYASP